MRSMYIHDMFLICSLYFPCSLVAVFDSYAVPFSSISFLFHSLFYIRYRIAVHKCRVWSLGMGLDTNYMYV